MTCQQYAALLETKLDGPITPEEELLLLEHREHCPACRAQAQLYESLPQRLAALNEDVPPLPEDFHTGWVSRLEDIPMKNKPVRTPWTRLLATAAAVVFVVGGTLLTRDDLAAGPMTTGLRSASYEERYDGGYASTDDVGYTMARSANSAAPAAGDVMLLSAYDEAMEMPEAESAKKIIRTASLTIHTPTFDETLAQLKRMCEDAGGWIAYASESAGGTRRTASLTLRVPSGRLDGFLEGAAGTGRITRRDETADDVTDSYYDTKTRLDTQLALMERLQALITTAAELSDLLALESQIADTQYQIDRLQSSLNATDRQVDYATVDISLREELPSDSLVETEKTLWQRLSDALETGMETFVAFVEDMAVFVVAALPFALTAAVLWLVVRLVRKALKRGKKKE